MYFFTFVILGVLCRTTSYRGLSWNRKTINPAFRLAAIGESLSAPGDNILDAVDRAGRRLSVSDAASFSGIDLIDARTQLMSLTSLTDGNLEVTTDGEIVYSFNENFRSTLLRRSPIMKLRRAWQFCAAPLYSLVRISFGVALFTSLAIIASAVLVASSSSSRSDDKNEKRGGGSGISFRFGSYPRIGPSIIDYLLYNPVSSNGYYDKHKAGHKRDLMSDFSRDRLDERGDVSFLESFFSFVFGDGDPNKEFSQAQLRAVAAAVRKYNGVVIAEQLAPFVDPPPLALKAATDGSPNGGGSGDDSAASYIVNESWVLPAVIKFGGEPAVTENGHIYYKFADLAATALDPSEGSDEPPLAVVEQRTPLSRATNDQILMVAALGVANLGGVVYLRRLLTSAFFLQRNPLFAAVLARLFPALAGYALLFVGLPFVRSIVLGVQNAEIDRRNKNRESWASSDISEKLRDVREHAGSDFYSKKVLGGRDDIVYSTKVEED